MFGLYRLLIWLLRRPRSAGYGIQSPTDYHFVRSVLNERWPYYKYEELRASDNRLTSTVGCLLFRLTNWRQPHIIAHNVSASFAKYLTAGCLKSKLVSYTDCPNRTGVDFFCFQPEDNGYPAELDKIVSDVVDNTVLVLIGIYTSKNTLQAWNSILQSRGKGAIGFDCYDLGVALFDAKRTPQHYKLCINLF